MRKKQEIINAFNQREGAHTYYFQQYVIELLADIRDAIQYISGRDEEEEEQFQAKHRD